MINEKYYKYGFFLILFISIALIYKSIDYTNTLKIKELQESNLRKALVDTLTHFKTKEGAWGAEKRTLQTDLNNLKDAHLNLTNNQKELLKQIEEQNKTAQTFAAALIELRVEVAKLKDSKPIVETDSTVEFANKTSDFEYDITISNVKPIQFKIPTLTLNNLSFPNSQTINFHWKDDKKEGYPISFDIINTNKYFIVKNIDSYSIPEIKKQTLKPSLWNRFGTFTSKSGTKIVIFSAGIAVGAFLLK